MVEDVDHPRVKDAVFIVSIAFDAVGEVPVAMKACGLLQDRAEHVEVMRVELAIAISLVELGERGHMVEEWRVPSLAEEKPLRRSIAAEKILVRPLQLVAQHIEEQCVMR